MLHVTWLMVHAFWLLLHGVWLMLHALPARFLAFAARCRPNLAFGARLPNRTARATNQASPPCRARNLPGAEPTNRQIR